jgi:hypothetical protein
VHVGYAKTIVKHQEGTSEARRIAADIAKLPEPLKKYC